VARIFEKDGGTWNFWGSRYADCSCAHVQSLDNCCILLENRDGNTVQTRWHKLWSDHNIFLPRPLCWRKYFVSLCPPKGADISQLFTSAISVYPPNFSDGNKSSACHSSVGSEGELFTDSSNGVGLPECWTPEQGNSFQKENQWLSVENGKLGCVICRNFKNVSILVAQGIRLSTEWREGKVGPFDSTRSQQQAALRKKIMEHRLHTRKPPHWPQTLRTTSCRMLSPRNRVNTTTQHVAFLEQFITK